MIEVIRQMRRDNASLLVVVWEKGRTAARCYHYHKGSSISMTRTGSAPWWAGAAVRHFLQQGWAVLEIYN